MAEAFLLVEAGGRLVGLPVAQLEAVTDPGPLLRVPSTEPALRGVATLRGGTLPVVDLRALLEGSVPGATRGQMAVIVLAGGVRLGLEVDSADVVFRGDPLPVPGDATMPWARAVMRHEGALVPLLDLSALGARLSETGQA